MKSLFSDASNAAYRAAQTRYDNAVVTRTGALDMQVCVPVDWTDGQVKAFADTENVCGTEHGWQIRHTGNRYLLGEPERVPCADRGGFVHIMLDA